VFLPSMVTTPLAGRLVGHVGVRNAAWLGLLVALIGLPLLVVPNLNAVLVGMVLVGVGTFFTQAVATGFVGRAATGDRAAASGLYLSSYYLGGLVGAGILGQVFDRFGWSACVVGVGLSLISAGIVCMRLRTVA
jgi:predicted MFS family arabinose efflux permease